MNTGLSPPTSFAFLPCDVIIEVFRYLKTDDMCRVRRVCKSWNEAAKEPILWIKVDAHVKSSNEVAKLIQRLPKFVTHLRICCNSFCNLPLWLPDVTAALSERCPNLKCLIIEKVLFKERSCDVRIKIQDEKKFHTEFVLKDPADKEYKLFCATCFSEAINLDQFAPEYLPKELRVMSLRNSVFLNDHFASRIDVLIPQVKVLDLSPKFCLTHHSAPFFSRFTNLTDLYLARCPVITEGIEKLLQTARNLKVLDLEYTVVRSETILALKRYGQSLEELYLGGTFLEDSYLTFENENVFDSLRVLCLRCTLITPRGLEKVFNVCPHLQTVGVSQDVFEKIQTNERYFFMHSKLILDNVTKCDHFRKNNHHK